MCTSIVGLILPKKKGIADKKKTITQLLAALDKNNVPTVPTPTWLQKK